MIQSSQPRSLKFTCSGFLLHRDLDFLPCLFPWRVLEAAVLLLLLALAPGPLSLAFLSRPNKALPSLLSLKRVCLFLDRVNTTKMAFFCWGRPCRCRPRCCRSSSLSGLSSTARSSRQKCFPWCCCSLNIPQTSNTSHFGLRGSCRSSVLESSSCRSRQERSWTSTGSVSEILKFPDTLVYILSSAPSTSAFLESVETSNRYCCLLRGRSGRSSAESITASGLAMVLAALEERKKLALSPSLSAVEKVR
ncbi:Protein GDF5OS, mitochondrial [Liparis tanakae]|uniref:Protein GDF5OS, mitochondrial n=1 Tax=Liparis tanakae TaxID=230148 RepID=A0A4Z2FLJ7_9TELE|nr:Protein GDF5OS, mitochondrial [Liparis tanakae]